MQLRYLQTLADTSSEKASSIVFRLPLDLIRPLFERSDVWVSVSADGSLGLVGTEASRFGPPAGPEFAVMSKRDAPTPLRLTEVHKDRE
jgi:hypothetical protein